MGVVVLSKKILLAVRQSHTCTPVIKHTSACCLLWSRAYSSGVAKPCCVCLGMYCFVGVFPFYSNRHVPLRRMGPRSTSYLNQFDCFSQVWFLEPQERWYWLNQLFRRNWKGRRKWRIIWFLLKSFTFFLGDFSRRYSDSIVLNAMFDKENYKLR